MCSARRPAVPFALAALGALLLAACEKKLPGRVGGQSAAGPETGLIAPESRTWSAAQAAERLGDERLGLSAAIRLVRLSGSEALCVPEVVTEAHWNRLQLVALRAGQWALGIADPADAQRLCVPVLIGTDGVVLPLAHGPAEDALVLCVARDPDVFPHLAIEPATVWLIEKAPVRALQLAERAAVRFDLRQERGYPYIGLMLASDASREVAQYRWDPYELMFLGPAIDRLPEPPGGKFEVDLDESTRLVPQGGELPEPEENPEPPPRREEPPGEQFAAR